MLEQISQILLKLLLNTNKSINQSQVTENEKVILRNHRIEIALNRDSCIIID